MELTQITISQIIKTSIVTAFTIATAFIWKEVLLEIVKLVIPEAEALLFEFISAILATILVVILIYIFLKTEDEFEIVIKKIKNRKLKKQPSD